ncbi:E3 ubiquitin-protein ligase UPL3-like [Lactuca sativa]|uniref:E3 ubiquitin-protein ligase UPL3-like n=1 Tax=Lactuca sativa TaxID=4236 RepID=UPI0022AEC459|nr:E3 ubiquitin-protein ligase UPL3-like [Lactuca sativa]
MAQKPRWGELEEEADGGDYDYLLPPKQVIGPDEHGLKKQEVSLILCITRQLEAFRAGFNQVFEASSLQIFSPSELDYLLCGRREMWEADTLVEHIKFDHGYTSKSPVVINLLEIMGEFNPEQQRAFCQFVTGAPRLPPGGLAVLNPKWTIVRKLQSSNNTASNAAGGVSESADDDLPSVMTCANYLKLLPIPPSRERTHCSCHQQRRFKKCCRANKWFFRGY